MARSHSHRTKIQRLTREIYAGAILDAAEARFLEASFADAKMADIARAAGVSVGTLYKHFPSKEALLVALTVARREAFFAALGECEALGDPREQLAATLDRALAAAEGGGALFAVYMQLRGVVESQIKEHGGVDEEQTRARFQHYVAEAYRQGVELGHFRDDIAPERFASALCGALNAELMAWLQAGRAGSLKDRGRALLDLLLRGVLK